MDVNEKIRYIRDHTDNIGLYIQMAEEAAELVHAALKVTRILYGRRPTPVTLTDALRNVNEEYSDLKMVMMILGKEDSTQYKPEKLDRWVERLQKMNRSEIPTS